MSTRLEDVLMSALGCKVEQDWPEGPCCDGSIPCAHPPFWFCAEHDWHEDGHAEGLCGYAAMLAAAVRAHLADIIAASCHHCGKPPEGLRERLTTDDGSAR